MFSLKKLVTQDLNPFDGPSKPQPGSTAQAVSGAQKNLFNVATTALSHSPIGQTAQLAYKGVNNLIGDTPVFRADQAIASGLGRSAVGTAQGASGLFDLATPGTGTSAISKALNTTAQKIDQNVAANKLSVPLYKGAQALGDVGQFATGSGEGKLLGETPKFVTKAVDPLLHGNFGQRVAGRTVQAITNPTLQATNAAFTSLQAGKEASQGKDINPLSVAAQNAIGGVGLPFAGAVGHETVLPALHAAENGLRSAGVIAPSRLNPSEVADLALYRNASGTYNMTDDLYNRGQAAAQKAGVDIQNPAAVDDLLNAHQNYATQRLAMDNPAVAQGGYVKNPLSDTAGDAAPKPTTKLVPTEPVAATTKLVPGVEGSSLPKLSIPEDAPSSGLAQRGYASTIADDHGTPEAIKKAVSDLSYKVRNTADLQIRAATLIKENPALALRVAQSDNTDIGVMLGNQLIPQLSRNGQTDLAIQLAKDTAAKLTKAGQTAQAASAYGKLSPEGVLRFTQSIVNEYNTKNISRGGKELVLTPERANKIIAKSEKLQTMSDGRAKDIATAEMLKDIKEVVPSSWAAKISSLQTIAQLLNPKTLIRNIGGNTMFGGLENASQTLAAGIDKGITGARRLSGNKDAMREVSLPNLKTQGKSFVKGAKEQYQETTKGINLGPETQFDLADTQTFRSGPLAGIEKAMGVALRVPDKAAYQAAYDDTLNGLVKTNKVKVPTQEMLEQANAMGLYRTFQNDSKAAKLFSGLKQGLNKVGFEGKDGKEFGLGDLILKYPKTPGNILSAGIDYSPAGIVKGITSAAINAAKGKPFDQAALANSLARGTVGTGGLVGTGAVLGSLGIITEKPSDDIDTRNLQKASGQGGYQINTSALRRFVFSGFNKNAAKLHEGDKLVSYDWAQPASIPLSAGAALAKKKSPKDAATSTIASASEGFNTLVEQPLVQGVSTLAGNIKTKGLVGAIGSTVQGAPSSFVPTALNQTRQLTDNTTRSTYDPNAFNQSFNMAINKIPGLDKVLKPQTDQFGNNKKNYQNDSNNFFNVAINPAFVNKYQPNANARLPLDILKNTGETQQIPQTPKFTQKIDGKNIKLTSQQYSDFTKYIGTNANKLYGDLSKDPDFLSLSQTEQATKISNSLSQINEAARIKVLGNKDNKVTPGAQSILNGDGPTYSTSPTGGAGINIAKSLTGDDKTFLKKYNALSADARTKASNTQNDFDYRYAAAKYANDTANGKLSTTQDIKAQDALAKAAAGKDFSKETRDLYGLSDKDLYNYVSKSQTGKDKKAIADQVIAYGDAVAAATGTKNKFRNKKGQITLGSSVINKRNAAAKSANAARLKSTNAFIASLKSNNQVASNSQDALLKLVKGAKVSGGSSGGKKVQVTKVALKKQTAKRQKAKVA